MSDVLVENSALGLRLEALRDCGKTTIPMKIALRMKDVQQVIRIQQAKNGEINNDLIERLGEGKGTVLPGMQGWAEFARETNELQGFKCNLGESFVLYSKDDPNDEDEVTLCWKRDMKNTIELTANVMADMGDLLVIREHDYEEEEEAKPVKKEKKEEK